MCAGIVTSHSTAVATPPAPSISSTTALHLDTVRLETATCAPARASYNAIWGKPVTADQTPLYNAYDDAAGIVTMDEKAWFGRMIIENLLAIDVPMIAAVNGPVTMHSEVPLLMDIVLASEDAYFQ